MTRVEKVLVDVAAALDAGARPYALIGGLAVSARTEPRFTRDVDWADLDLAKQALVLIEARGFARGKRLMAEFEKLVVEGG